MTVSILLCTRNRASQLKETLRSLRSVFLPSKWDVELVVVDNGSTDETRDVVAAESPATLPVRRVVEPQPGLSKARNTGVAATQGDVILFTDDDVRFPADWVQKMCTPLLQGDAHAVAGGVHLAPHLRRPWMTDLHAAALADTGTLEEGTGIRLVGANMAMKRSVFDYVPSFDLELGPGNEKLGAHEETLFSWQLCEAGLSIQRAYDVKVEHHPDPDRLSYRVFVDWAEKQGRSHAYVAYHWRHERTSRLRSWAARAYWGARLWAWTWTHPVPAEKEEGIDPFEVKLRRSCAYHDQMLDLIGMPRKYEALGLEKRSLPEAVDPGPSDSPRSSRSLSLNQFGVAGSE